MLESAGDQRLEEKLQRAYALPEDPGWYGDMDRRLRERLIQVSAGRGRVRGVPLSRFGLPVLARHPLAVLVGAIALSAGVAFAANAIVNLGKPANIQSTNVYFPLSGFHRVGVSLGQHGRPVLLFMGLKGTEQSSAMERWPLVKALDQFGSLAGAKVVEPGCPYRSQYGTPVCSAPTFDLSHASYRSAYLAFVNVDVATFNGTKLQLGRPLAGTEKTLWQRYACSSQFPCPAPGRPAQEPLVVVGGYLQTSSQMLVFPDFAKPAPGSGTAVSTEPLSFDTIHQALLAGKNPPYGNHLVEDVNAEANVITALICHADGRRPGSVCGRSIIRDILKHVR